MPANSLRTESHSFGLKGFWMKSCPEADCIGLLDPFLHFHSEEGSAGRNSAHGFAAKLIYNVKQQYSLKIQ